MSDLVQSSVISATVLVLCFGGMAIWSTSEGSRTRAIQVMEHAGYTDVKPTGWGMLECWDTPVAVKVEATSPKGEPVTGSVCCGLLRGCSVRLMGYP